MKVIDRLINYSEIIEILSTYDDYREGNMDLEDCFSMAIYGHNLEKMKMLVEMGLDINHLAGASLLGCVASNFPEGLKYLFELNIDKYYMPNAINRAKRAKNLEILEILENESNR